MLVDESLAKAVAIKQPETKKDNGISKWRRSIGWRILEWNASISKQAEICINSFTNTLLK
jgi:hypothetical protein